MLKRSVTLAAVIGVVVFVPSTSATGRQSVRISARSPQDAYLEQDDGFPNVGTTAEAAGVVDETCDGRKTHGVQEFKTTITNIGIGGGGGGGAVNAISASVGSQVVVGHFTNDVTGYFDGGTRKITITGTATPYPDGTFSTSGQTKITGGTGLYRGATGNGTFTGSIAQTGVISTQGTSTEKY